MHWTRRIGRAVRAFVDRERQERDLDDELRMHIELESERNAREGMPAEAARRSAKLAFGGTEKFKEACRDERTLSWFDDFRQDARHGIRALWKSPAYTAAVVITLALGIGANTAIFSVVNAVLLRPLPYADADRLVYIWENDRFSETKREAASVPDYFDLRDRAHAFSALAAFAEAPLTLVQSGRDAERVIIGSVSHTFFETVGVKPLIGRVIRPAEDRPGGERVVLISERFWRERFGGSPEALGRTLRLDDVLHTIVGVLPAGLTLPSEDTDVWDPLRVDATSTPRGMHNITVLGRLRAGVTREAAQREVTSIASALETEHARDNRGRGMDIEGVREVLVGDVRATLLLLLGAVALVLLIACANVANLLLARSAVRRREVAVRATLGATTGRLARQFLVENLILTFTSAALGIALAHVTLRALVALAPAGLPRMETISLDWRVLLLTAAVSALVAIVLGLLPTLGARRADLQETLRSEGRSVTGTRAQLAFKQALVVGEVALSVLLVVGAGLLLRSFMRLQQVDPGFRPNHVIKADFQLPETRYPQSYDNYPNWPEITRFHDALLDRMRALPGVQSAALAASHPVSAGFASSFVIEGREAEAAEGQAEIPIRMVTPDYFRTVGTPLLRGRMLAESDVPATPPVLLINQAMARRYFPDSDPIGKRIRFWGTTPREIVGVVGNEHFRGLDQEAPPAVYPPMRQTPTSAVSVLVQSNGDVSSLINLVRSEFRQLDPALAFYDVEPLDRTLSASLGQRRFTMLLLGTFAALALLLAMVGVHGLLAYTVAQRTREVGVRMALGATRAEVMGLVIGQGMRMVVLGAVAGALAALAFARVLQGMLYNTSAADALTFAVVLSAILVVALIASYLPARRATAVEPMSALRLD